ncbi:hypothetical protein VCRA2119O147_380009 [Vibrio crassostreae]|nr:hypothetical protein VCRA2113O351_100156 [Vibrio crassostreae]CAK1710138.1 hypothetical protein VCRA2117O378_110014 [Vibrio crassostreae]CAK1731107.1 hypothetical protein VCRA2113O326_120014 [Vibrio crassostreae]CAK1745383.1 hypothetical protein VCRA2113O356_120158 [Vibrio crassostreae]CAK1839587.1 hypothetical protein VCRA2113O207_10282 [Vibrio crassostreae]
MSVTSKLCSHHSISFFNAPDILIIGYMLEARWLIKSPLRTLIPQANCANMHESMEYKET